MKPVSAVTLLAACSVAISAHWCLAGENELPAKKHIVQLYSYRTLTPINADWDRGIRRALATGFPMGVRIDIEYLDLGRIDNAEYLQRWNDLLRMKYAGQRIDLVMPVYVQAFQFVRKHRDTLFSDVPVVFCSVNRALAEQVRGVPGMTGVAFQLDVDGTVNAARALFPHTQHWLVVSGGSNHDRALCAMVQQTLDRYKDQLQIEYTEGLPMPKLLEMAAALASESAVLILNYDQDVWGNDYTTADVVEQIAAVCPVPMFGLYDTLLGHGIIGGSLGSAESQGELAGNLAVRVLQGEDPSKIPITGLEMHQFMFDARQLQRWGVDDADLPPGSIIRYREMTLWEQHGKQILAGLTLLLLQSLVIAILLINRSQRIRAERSLHTSRSEAIQLAGRLLSAQEDERTRLARELHDDLSQRLAASAIEAGQLARKSTVSPGTRATLAQLRDDLISLSDDVHSIARQIHPTILDDLGLADALRSECDRLAAREDTAVDCQCGDIPPDLRQEVSLCLYRVAQEALWNAARHAQSNRMDVRLTSDVEMIHLEVRDFGVGFDVEHATEQPGLGLASMRERVRLVNGRLTIHSQLGSGTSITVDIPLAEKCT